MSKQKVSFFADGPAKNQQKSNHVTDLKDIDNSQDVSDLDLINLTKENPENFSLIVKRWQDPLYRFIKRISYFNHEDTEDILQEVFIKVYKNLNAYDDSFKFSSWIYQITRNQTIDTIRKKKSRPENARLEIEDLAKIFKSKTDLKKELEARDDLEKVRTAMDKLPVKYREVLILRFLEEKNYDEISVIVQKPKGTVASLIRRGRELLKNKL